MTRKKLSDEVSISELLQMRKEGLSNLQIAERLDVSPVTIYRYIGKGGRRAKPAPCSEERKDKRMLTASIVPEPRNQALKMIRESHTIDLQGALCAYHIDTCSDVIELKDEDGAMIVGFIKTTDIPALVSELLEIYDMMNKQASA